MGTVLFRVGKVLTLNSFNSKMRVVVWGCLFLIAKIIQTPRRTIIACRKLKRN